MKYNIVSKKTMRNKDFAAISKHRNGYFSFKSGKESLYRVPRGFFIHIKNEFKEISVVSAQQWLNNHHINYQTGW